MADSRLRRFLGGLGFGYVHTFLTVVIGLWLTPFLLRHLGTHDYGLWLLGAQVLIYLALLDLGIVQLLPRDVAMAAGRDTGDQSDVQAIVGRTARLVLWQLPVVAVVSGLVIWSIPSGWSALRWPLALVGLAFVVTFPFRVFSAVLQGLQDLTFLGGLQLVAWFGGTVATLAGIAAGLGLYAMSVGWVTTQVISALGAWRRVHAVHRHVLPERWPSLTLPAVRRQIASGSWISVSQIAQVLLAGTDLVVVGKLLGPESVVLYACTAKLVTLLSNQPQLFMQMALPALSELRSTAPRSRLFEVTRSMSQVTLLLSGAIAAVVLAINGPFVAWWVGETKFAGVGLTSLLLLSMLARHANATLVYTLFCFRYDRRIALTSVADGLVGLVAMMLLVPVLGLHGAALGPLLSLCLVSLPSNIRAVSREAAEPYWAAFRPLAPWLTRFVAVLGGVVLLMFFWTAHSLWTFVPLAVVVGIGYFLAMLQVIQTPPLGTMLAARLHPLIARAPRLARHFQKPAGIFAR